MVGWHHGLNGHGFWWTLRFGDGQGGLACCSSWGRKESDTTEQLNRTELKWSRINKMSYGYHYIYIYIYIYAFVKKMNEKIQTYHLLNQKVYSLRAEYTYNLEKILFPLL